MDFLHWVKWCFFLNLVVYHNSEQLLWLFWQELNYLMYIINTYEIEHISPYVAHFKNYVVLA
jgi:hypothetical protein